MGMQEHYEPYASLNFYVVVVYIKLPQVSISQDTAYMLRTCSSSSIRHSISDSSVRKLVIQARRTRS